VTTSAAVVARANVEVAADAALQTKSFLLVKKDQTVTLTGNAKVAASGLLLEGGNTVKVAAGEHFVCCERRSAHTH
jgi:hypothetical protein